ncbi:hypothetical protein [Pantanalinema sp. GBBB05]|uniref:hypothetical protein n=1 Tax=Pantanalinema sp. GBBB05 TaxID=2604139 RepID=UPI001D75B882|nr:peptide chain release factor 1 [Pantanalinema sp. GBBB05]
MGDPIERLKRLPWGALFQAALITVLVVMILEFLVLQTAQLSPPVARLVSALLGGSLGVISLLAIFAGIGALGVLVLEYIYQPGITLGSLWGLVLALALTLLLKTHLPLPWSLVSLNNELELIGIVIGVFLKGKPYWQSFRRW